MVSLEFGMSQMTDLFCIIDLVFSSIDSTLFGAEIPSLWRMRIAIFGGHTP